MITLRSTENKPIESETTQGNLRVLSDEMLALRVDSTTALRLTKTD